MSATRGRRLAAILVVLVGVGGCGGGLDLPERPSDLPPATDLSGRYLGTLEVEGELLDAFLVLEQSGEGQLRGRVSSPIGLDAAARGHLAGRELALILEYAGDCPGEGRLIGQVVGPGPRLLGRIVALDCTGRVEGGFEFTRESVD